MELLRQPLMDMERIRRLWYRLAKWEYTWLCLLLLITLAMHLSTIGQPAEPMFDEQHYVPDARSILQGHDTLRPEHPPLGKLFIVLGIFLFGDNPFGWRFFSVLFGTVGIILFYLICRQLAMPKRASLLATFLLGLDNLTFVQASVAMLDVYSVTFMLAAFWLYLKGREIFSGVSIALSALAKLTGVLALPAIGLYWLLAKRGRTRQFAALILMAMASFWLLVPLFDFAVSRQFLNPIDRVSTMLSLSSSLTFASTNCTNCSRPWAWILRPEIMAYWYQPRYVGAISFTIWALIIPSVLYLAFWAKKGSLAGRFGVSWFISTYLLWIPASLITDRISFVFYFYPTVGAICLGIGLGLNQLITFGETRKTGKLKRVAIFSVGGYLLLHVVTFVILSPVFSHWILLFYAQ